MTDAEIQKTIDERNAKLASTETVKTETATPPATEKIVTDVTPPADEKKRGRPKKIIIDAVPLDAPKTDAPPVTPNNGKSEINNFLGEYKQVQDNTAAQAAAPMPLNTLVSGYLLLIVIDAVFPSVIKKVISIFNPKYKNLDIKKIRLSKEEKEELEKLADEVAKIIFMGMSPLATFALSLTVMYSSKIIDYEMPTEQKYKPLTKTEKKEAKNETAKKK